MSNFYLYGVWQNNTMSATEKEHFIVLWNYDKCGMLNFFELVIMQVYKLLHFVFTSQKAVSIIPTNKMRWHPKPQMDQILKYAFPICYLHLAANCKTWQF